jgi:hypothetical protein
VCFFLCPVTFSLEIIPILDSDRFTFVPIE